MKYDKVASVLEQRIRCGDYLLTGLPAERELAAEQKVSHKTARRAVQQLIADRVLARGANGRLEISAEFQSRQAANQLKIAHLDPAFQTPQVKYWQASLTQAVRQYNVLFRPLTYVHWDDPVVSEVVNSFDGVFISPTTEPLPDSVANRLRSSSAHLVSLELDLTHLGIPSLSPFPADCIQYLLQYLWDLGHRKIACFNTQPVDAIIQARIDQWRSWCERRQTEAVLINEPVLPYENPLPKAYRVLCALLERDALDATAVVCTTEPAAAGCMRALREKGITIGEEVSVCAVNDEGMARYLNPTLTSLEVIDVEPYLRKCLEWMETRKKEEFGPLLLEPEKVPLFIGESTGPPVTLAPARERTEGLAPSRDGR